MKVLFLASLLICAMLLFNRQAMSLSLMGCNVTLTVLDSKLEPSCGIENSRICNTTKVSGIKFPIGTVLSLPCGEKDAPKDYVETAILSEDTEINGDLFSKNSKLYFLDGKVGTVDFGKEQIFRGQKYEQGIRAVASLSNHDFDIVSAFECTFKVLDSSLEPFCDITQQKICDTTEFFYGIEHRKNPTGASGVHFPAGTDLTLFCDVKKTTDGYKRIPHNYLLEATISKDMEIRGEFFSAGTELHFDSGEEYGGGYRKIVFSKEQSFRGNRFGAGTLAHFPNYANWPKSKNSQPNGVSCIDHPTKRVVNSTYTDDAAGVSYPMFECLKNTPNPPPP